MSKAKEWYRAARRRLVRATRRPPVGGIDFGDLGRSTPVSCNWGFDRGTPIDRLYIERFLETHAADIRGRVLEVSSNAYTQRYGGARVTRSDVLHPCEGNPRATIVADLSRPSAALEGMFDCIICTQTLQFIYEARRAASQLHRWLKPGGTLLATVPGISQISREDMQQTGDYWRFTDAALKRMFGDEFGGEAIEVQAHGNVLASVCLLQGIAVEDCERALLLEDDPQFQLLLTVRATRSVRS